MTKAAINKALRENNEAIAAIYATGARVNDPRLEPIFASNRELIRELKQIAKATPVAANRLPGHCRRCGTDLSISDRDTRAAHRAGWACREEA